MLHKNSFSCSEIHKLRKLDANLNGVHEKMTKKKLQTLVLDHSYKTMEAEGVEAIRMRDLAKACGCAVGSLYNTFETFEEIHFHLNLRTFRDLFGQLFDTLKNADEAIEDVLPKIGWVYITYAKEHTNGWKALFENAPKSAPPKWYREVVDEHFQKAESVLEKKYGITKEKAEQLISYFWFAIHGVSSIVLNKKATNHSDEFVQSYVDHCLRGIYSLL
jgi:AcrR family transcriptional regulator